MKPNYRWKKNLYAISFSIILFLQVTVGCTLNAKRGLCDNGQSKVVLDNGSNIQPVDLTIDQDEFCLWNNDSIIENNFDYVYDLKLKSDSLNNVHLFITGSLNDVFGLYHKYLLNATSIWSSPNYIGSLANNLYRSQIDVEADASGSIHLLCNDVYWIYYRTFNFSSQWSEIDYLDWGYYPKLELDSKGRPNVLYYKTGWLAEEQIYVRCQKFYLKEKIANGSWVTSEFITDLDYEEVTFDFTIRNFGNEEIIDTVIRIFTTVRDESYTPQYYLQTYYHTTKTNITGFFTPVEEICSFQIPYLASYKTIEFQLVSNHINSVHLLVDIPSSSENTIYHLQKGSTTWSSPQIAASIDTTNINIRAYFSASLEPSNYFILLYSFLDYIDYSIPIANLHLKEYRSDVGWSDAESLNTSRTVSLSPSITFDGIGDAHIVWFETVDDESTIKYKFGYGDSDRDGLINQDERLLGTDCLDPDTDNDEFLDGEEIQLGFDPLNPDEDADGMYDGWEYHNGLNATIDDSLDDFDGDLLLNLEEFLVGSLPNTNDTDLDAIDDFAEVKIYFTDPTNPDSDFDRLDDGIEINDLNSDPNSEDTDSDGMDDYYEWNYQSVLDILTNDSMLDPDGDGLINILEYEWNIKPNDEDHDNDGLWDGDEVLVYFTHPITFDTDADGLWDGPEVHTYGTDPIKKDTDNDYVNDFIEINVGLNPNDNDTDDDLMLDGYEYLMNLDPLNSSDAELDYDEDSLNNLEESYYWTDPFDKDTDDDLLDDNFEVIYGTSPILNDTDGDCLDDYFEIIVIFTSATNNDTDSDVLDDYKEYYIYHSDPNNPDSDQDGILDGEEIIYGTDPINEDSDQDGLLDGEELLLGTSPINIDTENDGMDDYWEYCYSLDPLVDDSNEDNDDDGVTNVMEYQYKANPQNNDSDSDLLDDYQEIIVYKTSPIKRDTDSDLLDDYAELFIYYTNPFDQDTDDDRLLDGFEVENGCDPLNPDTDRDGFNDGQELQDGTDPLNPHDNKFVNIRNYVLIIAVSGIGLLIAYYSIPSILKRKLKPIDESQSNQE